MRIRGNVLRKIISVLSSTLLLINSFSPYLLIVPVISPSPVGAQVEITPTQEPTPTNDAQTNPSPTEEPNATPATEVTPAETVTPQPTPEPTIEVATPTPTPVITTEVTPEVSPTVTETPLQSVQDSTPTPNPLEVTSSPSPPTPVPSPKQIEKVCLTDEQIKDSVNEDWIIDDVNSISETKDKVQLGVNYTFPLENKVTISFKCLPKDESLRTSLKIQQVKVADLKLPADVKTDSEYAYDITTGMTDGSFAYDVTLPKSESSTAEVSYIDKSIEEAKTIDVKADEVKKIDDTKLNQETDKVTASNIDHFTIFIATYADLGLVTSELAYLQGDTVYTSSTSLDSTKYYRVDIIEQNGSTRHSAAACITGVTSLSGSYLLNTSAPVGSNWKAEITKYNILSNCTAPSSKTDTGTASFEVKATSPTPLTNPTIPQTCGLDIALVIDNSNSISTSELNQMKAAFNSFVSALTGTPTQFSVTKFGSSASVVQGFTSNMGDVTSAINSIPQGEGATNWKEGIALARGTFDPRPTKANLMIFASDGDPTYPYCGGSMTCAADVNAAVVEANTTKQFPIRILALGIGEVVLDSGDGLRVENLKAISGHIVNGSTIMGSDVVTTNFSSMANDLANFASQSCGGTITINKYIDTPGNLATGVWSFTTNVPNHTTVQTNAGQVNIPNIPTAGNYTITEQTVNSGYSFGSVSCRNTQTGASVGTPDNANKRVTGITLGDSDIISCDFINTTNYVPACGNSIVDPGEQCDNGTQNGVACTPSYGQSCNYCSASCQTVPVPGLYCGDGIINGTETCDDGNTNNGDGCSATCQIETATLTVNKIISSIDPNDSGLFNLKIDGTTYAANVGNGGSTGAKVVSLGSHTVSETAGSGTDLTLNYTKVIGGDCASNGSITLATGENKTCTITNTRNTGSVTVNKQVDTDGDGIFEGDNTVANNLGFLWSLNGGPATNLMGSTVTYPFTFNQDFHINENSIAGYHFVGWYTPSMGGLSCSNPFSTTLPAGGSETTFLKTIILCNARNNGHLIVQKTTIPAGDTTQFSITASPVTGGTVIGGGTGTVTDATDKDYEVTPGTYSVAETVPTGWNKTGDTCQSMVVGAGETKTCLITNTKQGSITITKVDNLNSGQDFTFNYTPLGSATTQFILDDDNNTDATYSDTKIFSNLSSGFYFVNEVAASGWSPSIVQCTSNYPNLNNFVQYSHGHGTMSTALRAGENLTCTFENIRDTGSLQVFKNVDLNGDGDYTDPGETGATDWQWQATGPTTKNGNTNDAAVTVPTGDYVLSETSKANFHFFNLSCTGGSLDLATKTVNVAKDANVICTFENLLDTGNLKLVKVVDQGLGQPSDFTLTATGTGGFSDAGNSTTFHTVKANTPYTLSESSLEGYSQSGPWQCDGALQGNVIMLLPNQNVTCTINNTRDTGSLVIQKIIDADGNTATTDDQTLGESWEFNVNGQSADTDNPTPALTNSLGVVQFSPIKTGDYDVTETPQPGYELIDVNCNSGEWYGNTVYGVSVPKESVGGSVTCIFYNSPNGFIHGRKWDDVDGNGSRGQEDLLGDWTINLYKLNGENYDFIKSMNTVTDTQNPDFGWYWFNHLFPGEYKTCEVLQTGWQETYPTDNNGCHLITIPDNNPDGFDEITNFIEQPKPAYDFGNQRINPILQISKSNDGSDKSPGDTVIYTLKIKVLNSEVLGVKVKDLLPKGFSFDHIVSVTLNGSPITLGDPGYHSPGTYDLGDMNIDDEVIIQYQARIDGSQEFGLYKDLAWAKGTDISVSHNTVLALAQTEGYVDTNFVGTAVRVNGNLTEGGNTNIQGEVLGASTQLPSTGGNQIWLIMASILSLFGLLFMLLGFMIKKGKLNIFAKNLLIFIGLFVITLFVSQSTYAANLSIRVSEPKTPTKNTDFKIVFTVLDLTESGYPITAKCFYKKNLADGWTQFDSDKAIIAGGDTDSCQVNSSIINTSGQTYFFKANATNGVDSDDSETQGLVAVGYDDRDPSVPTNYRKEKIGDCQYKISFKTADDGMTSRVEIYRSENTTMSLDGSTKVGDIGIGPNTEGSFTNSVPDCNKTYYYVIRAFNVAGNSSGATGDSVTITSSTTTVVNPTTGAIPVINVTLPVGSEGLVLGEKTKEGSKEAEKKEEVINVPAKKGLGNVLGAVTKKENRLYLIIGSILGLAIIGYGVYLYKKKKQS